MEENNKNIQGQGQNRYQNGQQKPQGVPYRQIAEENEKLKVQNIQFAQVLQEICSHVGVSSVKDIPSSIDYMKNFISNQERIKFLIDFVKEANENKEHYPKTLIKDAVSEITWRLNIIKDRPEQVNVPAQQPEKDSIEEETNPEE